MGKGLADRGVQNLDMTSRHGDRRRGCAFERDQGDLETQHIGKGLKDKPSAGRGPGCRKLDLPGIFLGGRDQIIDILPSGLGGNADEQIIVGHLGHRDEILLHVVGDLFDVGVVDQVPHAREMNVVAVRLGLGQGRNCDQSGAADLRNHDDRLAEIFGRHGGDGPGDQIRGTSRGISLSQGYRFAGIRFRRRQIRGGNAHDAEKQGRDCDESFHGGPPQRISVFTPEVKIRNR